MCRIGIDEGKTRAGGAKSPGALLGVLRSLGFILSITRSPSRSVTGSDLHFRNFPPMAGVEDGCTRSGGLPGGGAEEREMDRETEMREERKPGKRQMGREWRASLRMIYDVELNGLSGQTGDTGTDR